jgi:peptidoglycan LD-endopeptidase LytH
MSSGRIALLVLVISALVVVSFMQVSRTHVAPMVAAHTSIAMASATAAGITSQNVASADEMQALAARRLLIPVRGVDRAKLRDNFDEGRGKRRHEALDIMAPRGTPVRAVDDGSIAKLYRGPMAGISVYQFDPAGKRAYFYAHLDRYVPGLTEGRSVARGDVIGYVGSTGNAPESAPHLHFAIHELGSDKRWWKGKPINPYALLRPQP